MSVDHSQVIATWDDTGNEVDRPNITPGSWPDATPPADDRELAEVDTLIERTDLDTDSHTLVAAGDPIPAELAHLPRRPRIERAAGKQRAGKR